MKKRNLLSTILLLTTCIVFAQNSKEDWVTYIVQKEKGPMTISSNLYYNFMGKPNYKNLLLIGTSTNNCLKNGYPNYLGLSKFYSFSDSIANRLDKLTKNRLVGVLTYQCSGFDAYYVKDTTGVRKNLQRFLDYNHALSKNYLVLKPDKKWKYYKENLIPKDLSDSFFTNHDFLNQLVSEGDDLTTPRKVSHWINFRSERRREKFINKIKPLEFSIDSTKTLKNGFFKYQVQISREDVITPDAIKKLSSDLMKLSLALYGMYDGWGAEAIKEE